MWVGEWPHFGTLGSGRTLLAQKMNGFVSVLPEKLKNGVFLLLESEGIILDGPLHLLYEHPSDSFNIT